MRQFSTSLVVGPNATVAVLLRRSGRSFVSLSKKNAATEQVARNGPLVGSTHLRALEHRRSFQRSQSVLCSTNFPSTCGDGTLIPRSLHQQTRSFAITKPGDNEEDEETRREVVSDLFHQYCQIRNDVATLDYNDFFNLLQGIGEDPKHHTAKKLFDVADMDNSGCIDFKEFLEHSDYILGGNPARIVLLVGGPGSGKGVLSKRLTEECHVVHLSSGNMLREEVARGSALGRQVRDIMARGELVSSAIMVALMKRQMRDHPGKRVLLDGFPRSLENAHDLVALCGKPELALHLVCDDTVLLERIIGRGLDAPPQVRREDDNFQTALERLRTFHKYHPQTMEWLREQHVPIVNLDCSGTPESVWQQLQAIGRLMRPAVKVPMANTAAQPTPVATEEDSIFPLDPDEQPKSAQST